MTTSEPIFACSAFTILRRVATLQDLRDQRKKHKHALYFTWENKNGQTKLISSVDASVLYQVQPLDKVPLAKDIPKELKHRINPKAVSIPIAADALCAPQTDLHS